MGTPNLKEIVRKTVGDYVELDNGIKLNLARDVVIAVEHHYGKQPHLTGEPIPEMHRGYYKWLEKQLAYKKPKIEMSEFGKLVADILGNVWDGLHHLSGTELFHKRTEWSNESRIDTVIYGSLSTWDFNKLTELVILCHDNAVKLDISGANIRYLRLSFSKRFREGDISQRHPILEEQMQKVRGKTQ